MLTRAGVLTTNTDLPAREVALKYKQLWMVEDVFRSMKSLLDSRPIFHKRDETIRGHVFCSFLALLLRKEWKLEWADVIRDLDNLIEMEVAINDKGYVFRGQTAGVVSGMRCNAATRDALKLKSTPVRRRWRESVSLRHFRSCNTLLIFS